MHVIFRYVSLREFEKQIEEMEGFEIDLRHPLMNNGFTKDDIMVPEYFYERMRDDQTVDDFKKRIYKHLEFSIPTLRINMKIN